MAEKARYRSVFISDLHLGAYGSKTEKIRTFLDSFETDQLYLVGDIVDGWVVAGNQAWNDDHTQVLRQLFSQAQLGVEVYFTPGNHDDFGHFMNGVSLGTFHTDRSFIHTTLDGRRILVVHGDKFDPFTSEHRWLAYGTALLYEELTLLNKRMADLWEPIIGRRFDFATGFKKFTKRVIKKKTNYEEQLVAHAISLGYDGVICGHIHSPAMRSHGEILYVNCGDFVEHGTAVVEHHDGRLELVAWDGATIAMTDWNHVPMIVSA
ncbi:MAG: UDP-2,3-diacylglucosamine diphosphatase [Fimbriimonas sp.]